MLQTGYIVSCFQCTHIHFSKIVLISQQNFKFLLDFYIVGSSLVAMLYNAQLLHYAGENGIAAYGVLMYVQFIFIAVFIGYSIGTAPIISYHYGAENFNEFKIC